MREVVLFGGSGYIGQMVAARLAAKGCPGMIIADLSPPREALPETARFEVCDVRETIQIEVKDGVDWIFNLAAVHREPGHEDGEYYETNVSGARNVCDFARRVGCKHILFASSIAVYGPSSEPLTEKSALKPISPYGKSKLEAEQIHQAWQKESAEHKLVICRPGVIFGPDDPGNIGRLIRAVRKGYFFFPGSPNIKKSYGYVYNLIDSFEFMMRRSEPLLTYNYAEKDTKTLREFVKTVQECLKVRRWIPSIPLCILIPLAYVAQFCMKNSGIHPVRVKKAALSTHVVPEILIQSKFQFKCGLKAALKRCVRD